MENLSIILSILASVASIFSTLLSIQNRLDIKKIKNNIKINNRTITTEMKLVDAKNVNDLRVEGNTMNSM